MEHQLYPVVPLDDPAQYQTAVLNFMCSQTCEWQGVDSCWEELESHWAFCVDDAEKLDPGRVDQCMQIIAATPAGECSYLPEECLLPSVALGKDRTCAVIAR